MSFEEEFRELSYPEAPKIVVKPPGPRSLKILEKQAELETRALLYPKVFKLAIESARGATIRDVDGNYYIDWVAGIAVLNVGHNNPYVAKYVREQLDRYWHWISEVPTEFRIRALEKIHSILPQGLRGNAKILTTVTGADACEAAVSLARWVTGKSTIIAFSGAYHGVHLGAVILTAKKTLLKYKGMPLINVIRAPYPYPYRCPFNVKDEVECAYRCLEFVEYMIKDPYSGAGEVAGIIFEPIQGEGGYIIPPREFIKGLREIADKYGVLLIDDEVQAGVGRTGKWWGIEHFGVTPDIMCISKAIGNGIPISFVAFRKDLDEKLPEMIHLGTYRANPLGLAATTGVIEYIESRNLLERTRLLGEYALKRFKELQEKYEFIGDVRGIGFMIGIEIVKSKENKEPDPSKAEAIKKELFSRGVLMHTCGHYGETFRFMSPLVITKEHLDKGLEVFEEVLKSLK